MLAGLSSLMCAMTNIEFADEITRWQWDELIRAHEFYMLEPKNKQAMGFCALLEREMANRAIAGADEAIKRETEKE